jgi:hypothetical protein
MKKAIMVLFGLVAINTVIFSLPEFKISIGGGFQTHDNFLASKTVLSNNYVFTNTGGATEYKNTNVQTFLVVIFFLTQLTLRPI